MAFENYTIKDIAKALNLSASTVSRALRDSYEISEETKKIVLEYAEKVNYRANPIARSLKERKSNSIGVVISEIANNFFSQVIDGIESVAYDKNYQVVISQTKESSEREKLNIEYLFSRSTDGLLLALSSETNDFSYLEKLIGRGFPIVFFDRVPNSIDSFKVIADNRQGAFEAVQYLIAKGKKRIAHLTGSRRLSITNERVEGYKKALIFNGLPFNLDLVKYCEYGGLHQEEIESAIAELVQENYDAIFISGDKLSTGYLQAIKNHPYFEDKEIEIAGFTNSKVVNLFSPTITAVRQPAFEMGKKAAELLIQQIESKYPVEDFETIVLPTSLIRE
jgi:LacI family transcriptional regulator